MRDFSDSSCSRQVAFKTLGCKLNQAETESLATKFQELNWTVVDFGEPADAIVVNGCTVTNTADRKSRSAINRALRSGNGEALVVMAGCFVDGQGTSWQGADDERTLAVGNDLKSRIPEIVDAYFHGELENLPTEGNRFDYVQPHRVFRTRAMIKIQDGCDQFCSYCIIPHVRGGGVSRPMAEVLQALRQALEDGYKEVVLTGVNMSRWEDGTHSFAHLVKACLEVEGDFRLRLGSVEPDRIDGALMELMNHPRMTPHMHLCLQSGSEAILTQMRRPYTAQEFDTMVAQLRQKVPHFNITTDVIVGFPGESEAEFAETLQRCENLTFGHIHTFPFSRRHGTEADAMGEQVSEPVKKERSEKVRQISLQTKFTYRQSLLGSTQKVLVERCQEDGDGSIMLRGLAPCYVPVRFPLPAGMTEGEALNNFFDVEIHAVDSGDDPDLLGKAQTD
ncbi:MAG: tRNA (N(6)-L-threonylcarbamoyladenosine(37)-C(2))-methylthiotransferase MtaB [Spirochaetales bacterium]|nr:tRNA (N(6)-L-threonylcarbamoyladenosine(37)-C(2))-methylthiotransferase MtaB [Spirochaetales bacterium]